MNSFVCVVVLKHSQRGFDLQYQLYGRPMRLSGDVTVGWQMGRTAKEESRELESQPIAGINDDGELVLQVKFMMRTITVKVQNKLIAVSEIKVAVPPRSAARGSASFPTLIGQ